MDSGDDRTVQYDAAFVAYVSSIPQEDRSTAMDTQLSTCIRRVYAHNMTKNGVRPRE
jgi:hypothetical protein